MLLNKVVCCRLSWSPPGLHRGQGTVCHLLNSLFNSVHRARIGTRKAFVSKSRQPTTPCSSSKSESVCSRLGRRQRCAFLGRWHVSMPSLIHHLAGCSLNSWQDLALLVASVHAGQHPGFALECPALCLQAKPSPRQCVSTPHLPPSEICLSFPSWNAFKEVEHMST